MAKEGIIDKSPGTTVRPDAYKKLLLLTDMIRGLFLPKYEDWVMHGISRKPITRNFISKLTLQNWVLVGIARGMENKLICSR